MTRKEKVENKQIKVENKQCRKQRVGRRKKGQDTNRIVFPFLKQVNERYSKVSRENRK